MKILARLPLLALFSLISASALALQQGQPLPPLDIPSKGEFILSGDKISYSSWSSSQIIKGSPALVFHMPARMAADNIIAPLKQRLEQEDYADSDFQSVSVVNVAEAMWGTKGLINSELAKNKKEHPSAVIVADDQGRGVKAWNVGPRDVVIAVINTEGKIKHLHKGKMDKGQIDTIIRELNEEVAKAKQVAVN